jgi:hypothetical protein
MVLREITGARTMEMGEPELERIGYAGNVTIVTRLHCPLSDNGSINTFPRQHTNPTADGGGIFYVVRPEGPEVIQRRH